MIRPNPVKYTCQTCGYKKTHRPQSDALGAEDFMAKICPKCKQSMEIMEGEEVGLESSLESSLDSGLGALSRLVGKIFGKRQ